ncbi:uncharacterized protein TNCV_1558651 [Trichonephila clavipes]|nr:uncharacterized protein TNCV_1558651 [Trichonephila clavipes]
MVSDGTEFAVGDIERLFKEARRNTETKQEKWKKYYNRRRRDVQIKVNDWVLVAANPLSSATRKVVAKLKQNLKVRIYRHRKCDETEIETGSSNNSSLRDDSTEYNGDQMTREMVKRKGQKSGGPERKVQKGSEHRVNKSNLSSNDTNSDLPKYRKKSRREETVARTTSGNNLRPRIGKGEDTRPTIERKTQQGRPVRSRKGRE